MVKDKVPISVTITIKSLIVTVIIAFPDITVVLFPIDGGSEPDEFEQVDFGFLEIERGLVYKKKDVTFIEADNVIDMEYLAVVTVTDAGGEELDYAEFRITGQE